MKLQNKLLRYFISAGVVVLTSSFLVYELVASHRDMSEYMRYIIEKGESAFLYDKYQNQLVISGRAKAGYASDCRKSPTGLRQRREQG